MKSCWLTIVIGATMFMSVFVGSAPASMDKSQKFDILEKPALFEGDIAGIAPQNGFKSSKEVVSIFMLLQWSCDRSYNFNGLLHKTC